MYYLPPHQKFQNFCLNGKRTTKVVWLDVLAKPGNSARMSTSIDLHPIQKEGLIIPRAGSCYETQSQALVINTCGNE